MLAWLLEHEPAAGMELALAWAEDPATADPVLGLAPESLPKPARKALRRVHHHLRSRGVAVPEAAPAATVATLAPLDEGIDEARVTALDPHGVRIAYLATDRAGGGVRLFELALDDARGVLEFEVFEAGRSRARRFLRDAGQREQWSAVPAPSASVRALIARAAAHQASDRSAPRQFAEWRTRLCEVPPGTQTPGALAREALGAGAAVESEVVCGWVREGVLGPWPPPIARVQPLIERLDELAKGVVIVSGAARRGAGRSRGRAGARRDLLRGRTRPGRGSVRRDRVRVVAERPRGRGAPGGRGGGRLPRARAARESGRARDDRTAAVARARARARGERSARSRWRSEMRRRFGRGRRNDSEGEGRAAPIDAAQSIAQILAARAIDAERLEPVELDGVPATFAVLGVGENAAGRPVAVGFAPDRGADAALAVLALAAHRRGAGEPDASLFAVAPDWTERGSPPPRAAVAAPPARRGRRERARGRRRARRARAARAGDLRAVAARRAGSTAAPIARRSRARSRASRGSPPNTRARCAAAAIAPSSCCSRGARPRWSRSRARCGSRCSIPSARRCRSARPRVWQPLWIDSRDCSASS